MMDQNQSLQHRSQVMMDPNMYFEGWTHRAFTTRTNVRRNEPQRDPQHSTPGVGNSLGPIGGAVGGAVGGPPPVSIASHP